MLAIMALQTSQAEMVSQQQLLSPEEIKLQTDQIKYKAYIPQNYALFEAIEGDLSKDGKSDLVFIMKAKDQNVWVDDEYRCQLDRNRRGIVM